MTLFHHHRFHPPGATRSKGARAPHGRCRFCPRQAARLAVGVALTVVWFAPAIEAQPDPRVDQEGWEQEELSLPESDRTLSEPIPRPADATPELLQQLEGLERALAAYESEVAEYLANLAQMVDLAYQGRQEALRSQFDEEIERLRQEERAMRQEAIDGLERFVERYPDHSPETPDALFRLAELYFEQESDDRIRADADYQEQLERYDLGIIPDRPEEPRPDYHRTIATFARLIEGFPDYRQVDGAYYLMAYSLLEMRREEEAAGALRTLVAEHPRSDFAQESWLRIGEYLFDINEYEEAAVAYQRSLEYGASRWYDKALFKLGWSCYLANRYDEAMRHFGGLIAYYEGMEGEIPGALREEALQYMAVVLSEEDWDLDGVRDQEAGMPRVRRYLAGNAAWEQNVCDRLARVWFDGERYELSMEMYRMMLERWPSDPENPQRHERIVACLSRRGQFDAAFDEQMAMNAFYRPGSAWYEAQREAGRFRAMAYAQELARNTLLDAARYYNQQADTYRDQAINDPALESEAIARYRMAAEGYADFLQQYPADRLAYEVRFYYAQALYYSFEFEQAARQYALVRDTEGRSERRELAGYQVVRCLEEALYEEIQRGSLEARALPTAVGVQAQIQEQERQDVREVRAPEAIPALSILLVEAYDRYQQMGLHNADDPTTQGRFAFLAAKLYFDYSHLEEARARFITIIENPAYACQDDSIYAAAFLIETFRLEDDYQSQEIWSQRLAAIDRDMCGEELDTRLLTEFQAEAEVYRLGAIFASAEDLFQAERYEEAAMEYVRLVNQNPRSDLAPAALNNAAVGYEYLRRHEAAMGLYQRIVSEYPGSEHVNHALWRLAENSRKFFDFDRAINTYLVLADREEDQDRVQSALFQAARLQEMRNQFSRAAATYEGFATRFPEADRAPLAFYQAGLMHEREGRFTDMERVWGNLRRTYASWPSTAQIPMDALVLDSLRRTADYYAQQLQDRQRARQLYQMLVEEFERRRPTDIDSLFAAGKARFSLVQEAFEVWNSVAFEGDVARQRRIFQEQIAGIRPLVNSYNTVISIGSAEWTMAAYFMIGRVYQAIADKLYAAPVPAEIAEDEVMAEAYQMELEEFASQFEDEAVENWRVAMVVGQELAIVNEWTIATIRELNRYLGSEFPLYKEEPVFFQTRIFSPPPLVGMDGRFLTAPRVVPSRSPRGGTPPQPGIEELQPEPEREDRQPEPRDVGQQEGFLEEL
ncbi:MAG: tetratricopeptide repeat protein [Bradymonadales bacterium]|nr:tetratricopeptide repeat protein [Bradymonadales bacterium]